MASLSFEIILASAMALPPTDQRRVVEALMTSLIGKPPRAKKSTGGASSEGGASSGSGGSWWTEATKRASEVLKPLRETENTRLVEAGMKKLPGTCAASILSALKTDGKLSKEVFPSDAELKVAFDTWVAGSHKEETASATSGGSKVSKGTKFSELSPEEQKARRSESAKKAAATRAANKAAAAGGAKASPALPVSDSEDDEPPSEESPITLTAYKLGKKDYKSFIHEGVTHLYSNDDEETWLGTLQGKKIIKEGFENPLE